MRKILTPDVEGSVSLPCQLSPDRDYALLGRDRIGYLSEKAAGGVGIGRGKLGMVQHIRTLETQLEGRLFRDLEALKQAHVPVIDAVRPHPR
jgi:hypothetical protein